jgi:hypothetical protein
MNWSPDQAVAEVRMGCEFTLNPALPDIIAKQTFSAPAPSKPK